MDSRNRNFTQKEGLFTTFGRNSEIERKLAMNGMADYFMSEYDEGAKKRTFDRYGETIDRKDISDSNYYAGHAIARINGMRKNPEQYFLSQGMELPANARTKSDFYEAIGADYGAKIKTAYDEKKAEEAEARRIYVENQQSVDAMVNIFMDNEEIRASTVHPELRVILNNAGLSVEDLQRAGYAYRQLRGAASGNALHKGRAANAAAVLVDSPKARHLVMERLRRDGEKDKQEGSSSGFVLEALVNPLFDAAVEGFAGGAVMAEAAQGFGQYANDERVINEWHSLLHDAQVAYNSGQTENLQGAEEVGYNVASFVGEIVPYFTPMTVGAGVSRSRSMTVNQMASQARGKDVPLDEIYRSASIVAGIEGAANTISAGAFGGLALKSLPFLRPFAARVGGTRAGSVAAASGVAAADITVMPFLEFAGKGAAEVLTGQDESIRIAYGQYQDYLTSLQDPEMLISLGILGALGGASSTPAYRQAAREYRVSRNDYLVAGGKGEDFDKAAGISDIEKRNQVLADKLSHELTHNREEVMRRQIGAYEKKLSSQEALERKSNAAYAAAMKTKGLSVGLSDKDGHVRLYYEGESRPDGTFDQGQKFIDLTSEDADTFVAGVLYDQIKDVTSTIQHLYARDATVESFLDSLDGDVRLEKMLGAETMDSLRGRAAHAQEKLDALMSEGMSEADARKTVFPAISENETLGSIIMKPEQFAQRLELERQRGGDTSTPLTRAYVVTQFVGDDARKQRILRMSHDATLANAVEELAEQSVRDRMQNDALNSDELYRELVDLREWMRSDAELEAGADSFLGLDESIEKKVMDGESLSYDEMKKLDRAVIEGTSRLIQTSIFSRAMEGDSSLPVWAADTFASLAPDLLSLTHDMALASALKKAREFGQFDTVAGRLMNATEADYEAALAARQEPTESDYLQSFREYTRDQMAYDAMLGSGVANAPAITDRFIREADEGQARLDEEMQQIEEESISPESVEHLQELEESGLSHEQAVKQRAEQAADAKEELAESSMDAEQDEAFSSGRCVVMEDDMGYTVKSGLIAVDSLQVLPNFKLGADADGVVHPLAGDYRPDHDPIRVWRKEDGSLMVISGRHRLDAAKRAGASRIASYVYDESPYYNEAWARRYDVESNIRDNQATELEVALYVRGEFTGGESLSDEAIARAGLDRKGSRGAKGVRIGRVAGTSIMDALRNGLIEVNDAFHLSNFIPYNDAIQAKGLALLLAGESRTHALARMEVEAALQRMQQEEGLGGGFDLFGNRLDNEDFMNFVAKYISQRRGELNKDKQYLKTLTGRKTSKAMAERYGVDIKDPDALNKARAEVDAQLEAWANPYTSTELMDEIRKAWRDTNPLGLENGHADFSLGDQRDLILTLREDAKTRIFVEGVDEVEKMRTLHGVGDEAHDYMPVSSKLVEAILELSQGKINLEGRMHAFTYGDLWHAYRQHCLDSFRTDNQFNVTYDDIRSMPDVIENYDYIEFKQNRRKPSITLSKGYGDARLEVVITVPSIKKGKTNPSLFITGWVKRNDGNKNAPVDQVSGPTALKGAWRTVNVTPAELYIKENFSDEAKIIAQTAYKNRNALTAPNKQRSYLEPVQWLMVRLQSFKRWFGDWEHDPANASKVVDENGEPLVVYHGTNEKFNIFDMHLAGKFDNGTSATRDRGAFFTSNLGHAESHAEGAAYYAKGTPSVMPVFIQSKNPLVVQVDEWYVERKGYTNEVWYDRNRRKIWEDFDNGDYDGIIITGGRQGYMMPVVLSPTQIKSATHNRGGFDDSPRIDFSIGGMQAITSGAARDRGLVFLDPADGKEKFFIDASSARIKDGLRMGRITSIAKGGHKDTTMASLVECEPLFEAYPEFKEMRVRLYKPLRDDGIGGYFRRPTDGQAGFIAVNAQYVNASNPRRLLGVLMHELQHAIQAKEGHARGAGISDIESALAYIDEAIEQRKKKGVDDDWSKDNLEFMEELKQRLLDGDESAAMAVYYQSHGEQEAYLVGGRVERSEEMPALDDYTETLTPRTVAIEKGATELGGLTFDTEGRFEKLMNKRLGYAGEFDHDRILFQMRESINRRVRELESLSSTKSGDESLALAHEVLSMVNDVEKLLPPSYGFALEPYKLWLSVYAKLAGSGKAFDAAMMINMRGWDEKMFNSFYNDLVRVMQGRTRKQDVPFWAALEGEDRVAADEIIASLKDEWDEIYKDKLADGMELYDGNKVKAAKYAKDHTSAELHNMGLVDEFFKLLGKVKIDRVMSKFLERVAMQLDHYRKDTKLGQIRRVFESIMPVPTKDGRPMKGKVDVEVYNHAIQMMRLLELTPSQKEATLAPFQEKVDENAEESPTLWDDMNEKMLIPVEVFNDKGEKEVIRVSKQEFEVYSCYEAMSANQAEAVSKALGEFITTGKQAWQNAIEAQRAKIQAQCMPVITAMGGALNTNQQRQMQLDEMNSLMPTKSILGSLFGWLMNDAQAFDTLQAHEATRDLGTQWVERIAAGRVYTDTMERDTAFFMATALSEASGAKNKKQAFAYMNEIKSTKETNITLQPVPPNFMEDAVENARKRILGLFARKLQKKNARPDIVAATIEHLSKSNTVPDAIMKEISHKYGTAGDAEMSKYRGRDALIRTFSEHELELMENVNTHVQAKSQKMLQEWKEKDAQKSQEEIRAEQAPLIISRAEAAYLVALCEQEDLAESLRQQGYTDEVVSQLAVFAGDDVIKLMKKMRIKLNERTEEIKAYYEKKGVPFPEVDNYFRAFFNVGVKAEAYTMLDGHGVGHAAGGGIAKILYTRRKHNAKPAQGMDIFGAFYCGMKEQTNLLAYGQLTEDMAGVLNYKSGDASMRDGLKHLLGRQVVSNMDDFLNNLSRLMPEVEMSTVAVNKIASAFTSNSSISLLSWYMGTLAKQPTAIFNTLHGVNHISFTDWMRSLMRLREGSMKISLKEMKQRDVIKSRFKGYGKRELEEALRQNADLKNDVGILNNFHRRGMDNLAALDVDMNARSAQVMYDASYRYHEKDSPNLTHSDYDALAMADVTVSLAKKSQPTDWKAGSLYSSKRTLSKVFSLFLGGESINTLGRVVSLAAGGQKKKALQMWLTHGAALQALTFLFNLITDDEEMREKRNPWAYFTNAIMGPLMGIPIMGDMFAGVGNAFVSKGVNPLLDFVGVDVKLPKFYASGLVPFSDIVRSYNKVKAGLSEDATLKERVMAFNDVIRFSAVTVGTAFSNPKTAKGAKAQALLLGVAAIGNVADFITKAATNIYERVIENNG